MKKMTRQINKYQKKLVKWEDILTAFYSHLTSRTLSTLRQSYVSHPIYSAAVLRYAEEILLIYQCVLVTALTEQEQAAVQPHSS